MKYAKHIVAAGGFLVAGGLVGCASNVAVNAPQISPMEFASSTKAPGRYAVMIQSGAWKTEVKAEGWTCSAWSFPTDFEVAYAQAAHAAFEGNFENIVFTPQVLKPEELKTQNLDAQIIVYEGGLRANFGVTPGLWTATIGSKVIMDGTVAVIGSDGKMRQGSATGSGTGTKEVVMGCNGATDAIGQAGSAAIKDFVLNAVTGAKLNVMEMKLKTATSVPSS